MIEFRPVGYIVGWLVLLMGVLMFLPLVIDLHDGNINAEAFALSSVLTIVAGAGVAVACADNRPLGLSLRQGFLLTTGSWTVFPAVGALPMMLGAPQLSFTDAYFEAMSAMTTTGATVISGLDYLPRGLLFWRGLLQWMGGIGVILLAMILLPILNIGGMQLLRNADFNTLGKIMPRTKGIALSIGSVYAGLTLACALGYVWAGMTTFDGIVHAMTTLATGGMGNHDSSFASFSPAAQYIGTVFMLAGAMSFSRFVQFARGTPSALLRDSQIRAFLVIYLGFVVALVAARALRHEPVNEATVREVAFNLASVISTTGFASTDYSTWGPTAWTLIFCSMMICGCSGSTTGGPKVFRYRSSSGRSRARCGGFTAPTSSSRRTIRDRRSRTRSWTRSWPSSCSSSSRSGPARWRSSFSASTR